MVNYSMKSNGVLAKAIEDYFEIFLMVMILLMILFVLFNSYYNMNTTQIIMLMVTCNEVLTVRTSPGPSGALRGLTAAAAPLPTAAALPFACVVLVSSRGSFVI